VLFGAVISAHGLVAALRLSPCAVDRTIVQLDLFVQVRHEEFIVASILLTADKTGMHWNISETSFSLREPWYSLLLRECKFFEILKVCFRLFEAQKTIGIKTTNIDCESHPQMLEL